MSSGRELDSMHASRPTGRPPASCCSRAA